MVAFATPDQFELATRPLTPDESIIAPTLLDYASEMLRASDAFPDIDERVADGSLSEKMPRLAVINMVKRVLDHPNTALASKTTGPFTHRYRDEAIGLLEITDAEARLLRKPLLSSTSSRPIYTRPGLWS